MQHKPCGYKNTSSDLPAESIETALSITQTLQQGTIKATLDKSNFAYPAIPQETQHVVLCLDNDGNDTKTDPLIYKAAENFTQQHKTVWIATPTDIDQDYNDLLKHSGSEAVKTNIEKALVFTDYQNSTRQASFSLGDYLLKLNNNPLPEITHPTLKHAEPAMPDLNREVIKSIAIPQTTQIEKTKDVEIEL